MFKYSDVHFILRSLSLQLESKWLLVACAIQTKCVVNKFWQYPQ